MDGIVIQTMGRIESGRDVEGIRGTPGRGNARKQTCVHVILSAFRVAISVLWIIVAFKFMRRHSALPLLYQVRSYAVVSRIKDDPTGNADVEGLPSQSVHPN